jgi:hypothetical protein
MEHGLRERLFLAAAGAAHGLAIWLLVDSWPDDHGARAAAVSLLTFLAVTALVMHFAWTGEARGRLAALTVGTGLVYAAVAGWVGWSLPDGPGRGADRVGTWFLTSLATLYVLGPFLQIHQRTGRLHFPYRDLFLHGWNNFFVALVGLLFVGALWTVLLLWAALFDLVGVELFEDLFSEEAFVYPVTGAAAGFGVALGRESERVVSTLRGITLAVFRGLLPLVAFVALIFLATLPFTGLEGLWDTDHATQLLVSWVTLTVLFLNAVYQDGADDDPLPRPVRWLVEAALVGMVAFVAIAVYGLSLRIGQYGLTPQRFWGVLFTVVIGSYAVGYALAVARRGRPWLRAVRAVNLFVALLIVSLGLLAHTPVLDPIGWSARSQYARLASGRADAADFDFGYLQFRLGSEGRERLAALEALDDHPEIETIRRLAEVARGSDGYWDWQQREGPLFRADLFRALPPGLAIPPALLDAAREDPQFFIGEGCREERPCIALRVELDGEAPEEWVLVVSRASWVQLYAFGAEGDGFRPIGQLQSEGRLGAEEMAERLDAQRFHTEPPGWRDLVIGETRYRLIPWAR